MAKAIFVGFFVIFFGIVGLIFAFQFDMLPQPLYSLVYKVELSVPFLRNSIPPSLEKFEGTWSIAFAPIRAQSDIGSCAIETGLLHVHAGTFSGTIGGVGSTLPVNASTTDDGRMTGTIGGTATVRKGTLAANLQDGYGRGAWNDQYECSGTIVLTKQEPASDPVQGTVVSVDGDVELVRGSKTRPLLPGRPLYMGDVIEVHDGTALLGMGVDFGTAVNLTSSATYKVGQ
jgi:hypothetical protein